MNPLPRREVTAADEMKALAHPLRQRIYHHLAFAGPQTATSLARAFGESTGATSYHLRQLARFGFVEEDPDRSRGRQRWWRIVPLDLRTRPDGSESAMLTHELRRLELDRQRELLDRYLAQRDRFGPLAEASMFSSSALRLTEDELRRFTEAYVELVKRWWREPGEEPETAVPVVALFYAFPWPGE